MRKKNVFHFLIPEKLKNKIAEIEKAPPDIPGFDLSILMEIIHLVCTKQRDDGYSRLKLEYLRRYSPYADHYIKFLLQQGIIERSKFFQRFNKCYGYKFTPEYQSLYKKQPLTNTRLQRKIERISKVIGGGQNKLVRDFSIDPEALQYSESIYTDMNTLNYAIASIQKIQNNEKFAVTDTTSFRYHSNLTILPRELRQFVSIYGKHLTANVDIKNSQPYFSTLLLTAPAKVADMAKGIELRMMLKSLQVQQNEDIKLYINLVCKGKFYEYLVKEFNNRGLNYDRDQVKKSVMQILFDANSHLSKERKIFAELFPTVHSTFNVIRGNRKGDHFTSFKRFAILLQTIEAYVVLKIILRRVNLEHPDVITFTVHDSLLTTSNPTVMQKVMTEELKKFVGQSPIIKIEKIAAKMFFNEFRINTVKERKEEGSKGKGKKE